MTEANDRTLFRNWPCRFQERARGNGVGTSLHGGGGRSGITVVELLAAIGILLILMGLLLPAIQRARAAARGLRCRANLRELAVAVTRYEQLYAVYPPVSLGWWEEKVPGLSDNPKDRDFSPHTHLLPFLGYSPLYNAINLNVDGFGGTYIGLPRTYAVEANWTALHSAVGVFTCPSDSVARRPGSVNYVACVGLLDPLPTRRGWPDSGKGIFHYPPISTAYVADGLSHTVMFSERLVGDGNYSRAFQPSRDALVVSGPPKNRADHYARICAHLHGLNARPLGFRDVGRYWMLSGLTQTWYNHALPPNSVVSDCVAYTVFGAVSARSAHPGCVHVAFGDTHVRSVGETISLRVWRALATRSDGEPIEGL